MSLGSDRSRSLNTAVAIAVNLGLTVVVAAGNDDTDASGYSPASSPAAFTVGSIDIDDTKSSFSNYGTCTIPFLHPALLPFWCKLSSNEKITGVDIFAPGRHIISDYNEPGNDGTTKKSGTSISSPHVAGLALCLIAKDLDKDPWGPHERLPRPFFITRRIIALAKKNSRRQNPGNDTRLDDTTTLIAYNGY